MKVNTIRKIVIILLCVLFVILTIVLFINMQDSDKSIEANKNNVVEDTEKNNENSNNKITQNNTKIINDAVESKRNGLKPVYDVESYLLMNNFIQIYYETLSTEEMSVLIDDEAKNMITTNMQSIGNASSAFCIDDIYEQYIDYTTNFYVVDYRIETEESKCEKIRIGLKVDSKDKAFSIYPYEFFSKNNYLNSKEDDIIKINQTNGITLKDENRYKDITYDAKTYMQELFKRYKFDLLLDIEHLYNTLNEEYKNKKFPTFSDFENYINENKSDLSLDKLNSYSTVNHDESVEYKGIGENRTYVFNSKNLMDYTLSLDDYEVVQDVNYYNKFLPHAKAQYCIDRVIKAINNKDYEFVYEKLNPIAKNNIYPNIEDFKNYIDTCFYDKNTYEIASDYLIISDKTYQFNVKITDNKGVSNSVREYTITVTLEDNADFTIAIGN